MKKKTKKRKGFSMLEAILSMAIVSIGLVGALALLSRTTRESMDVRDQVIGGMLAQEGVEIIRNMRDNSWAKIEPTASFSVFTDDDFACDYLDLEKTDTCDSGGKRLYLNGDYYDHGASGIATRFSRKINLDSTTISDKLVVTSMVIWKDGTYQTKDNCTAAAKCAYTETVLSEWGE